MKQLDREEVLKVLKCPYKPLLILALQMVNLTEKESNIIDNIFIKGYTEEETAIEMQYSRSTIQTHKKRAYEKMSRAWKDKDLINEILQGY